MFEVDFRNNGIVEFVLDNNDWFLKCCVEILIQKAFVALLLRKSWNNQSMKWAEINRVF